MNYAEINDDQAKDLYGILKQMSNLQAVELVGNELKKSTKKMFADLKAKLESDDEEEDLV